ncbi:hypothetical protein MKX08_005955 [Trichoderma sp. CBMAI-0020]|nr:hypothetical protein MKX08_005955 [Trichoderma sp. CBMAI-0020]
MGELESEVLRDDGVAVGEDDAAVNGIHKEQRPRDGSIQAYSCTPFVQDQIPGCRKSSNVLDY